MTIESFEPEQRLSQQGQRQLPSPGHQSQSPRRDPDCCQDWPITMKATKANPVQVEDHCQPEAVPRKRHRTGLPIRSHNATTTAGNDSWGQSHPSLRSAAITTGNAVPKTNTAPNQNTRRSAKSPNQHPSKQSLIDKIQGRKDRSDAPIAIAK